MIIELQHLDCRHGTTSSCIAFTSTARLSPRACAAAAESLDVRDGVADQGHLVHLRDFEDHCTQGVEQLIQLLPPLPLRLYSICYL